MLLTVTILLIMATTIAGWRLGYMYRPQKQPIKRSSRESSAAASSSALPMKSLQSGDERLQSAAPDLRDKGTDIEPLPDFDWRTATPMNLRPFKPTYHITMGVCHISSHPNMPARPRTCTSSS